MIYITGSGSTVTLNARRVIGQTTITVATFCGNHTAAAIVNVISEIPANQLSGNSLAQQIQAEGIVLLQNNSININGVATPALPIPTNPMPQGSTEQEILATWDKTPISVFGWGASNRGTILGGSGSADSISNMHHSELITTRQALAFGGFEYYTPLMNMLENFVPGGRQNSPLHSMVESYPFYQGFWNLYEPSPFMYQAHMQGAVAHSDTALIVLSRRGGEGGDLLHHQVRWNGTGNQVRNGSQVPSNYILDTTRTYLDITPEEENLIDLVTSANFSRVILMINAANPVNLSVLDNSGIHAAFVTGFMGAQGAIAVADVLRGYRTIRYRITDDNGEYVVLETGNWQNNYRNMYQYNLSEFEFSPSGRTVNTFTRNVEYCPTFVNSSMNGTRRWIGTTGVGPGRTGERFIEYMEGIFVDYRYFETARYEAANDNFVGFNYDHVVQFPFGFGLSFTEFEWEIVSVYPARNSTLSADTTFEIQVRVTNIGNRAGSDVVQAYFNAPYTTGEIEKPYIRLAAFAKTNLLQPNQYQIVTLSFDLYHMASYDAYDKNNNGFAGFEFDAGIHNIRLQTNARFIASDSDSGVSFNNTGGNAIIPFVVGNGGIRYNKDIVVRDYIYTVGHNGNVVRTGEYTTRVRQFARNRFTGDNAFAGTPINGSLTGTPQNFLSRADFASTFPRYLTPNRLANAYTKVGNTSFIDPDFVDQLPTGHTRVPQGIDSGLRKFLNGDDGQPSLDRPNSGLLMQLGANFYDPLWQDLLSQIPATQEPTSLNPRNSLQSIVQAGGFGTAGVSSIGKPNMRSLDGVNGLNFNVIGQAHSFTAFPSPIVLGQTWNSELALQFGIIVSSETKTAGISGWYAPGTQIHRSGFGGRNFEYFSASPIHAGMMATNIVKGSLSNGVMAYVKHFALNESSQNDNMLNTFLIEQALRENFLKSFELAVKIGGANALMGSPNRVGTVWQGSNGALNIGILRDEWGFRGHIVTDFAQTTFNGAAGLRNGNDLWLTGFSHTINRPQVPMLTDMDFFVARRAVHNILFSIANTYYLSQINS